MKRRVIVSALLFLLLTPWSAAAQEREALTGPDWSFSAGVNAWFSTGESKWEHEVPLLPGFTGGSRLTFRDVNARVFSIDTDLVWRNLVLMAAGGWGEPDGGDLIDEDFIANFNFSRTRSSIDDGHVYFANVNVGYRILDWADFDKRQGYLDLLVGYQWWREKYVAFGIVDQLGFVGNEPASTKVITETWTWHSLRIGGRTFIPFPYRLGLRVNAFFLPWASVEVEDIHHLRTDLRQNPSVVLDASGGFGWQVEGAITYTFWRGLGVEAGYRHWNLKIKGGDTTFRAAGAPQAELSLREVSTERGGPFFGLYYRF